MKTTYTFVVEYEDVDLPGEPKSSITMHSFDGTHDYIDVIVDQFAVFLKAAGYSFDHLEVIKDTSR